MTPEEFWNILHSEPLEHPIFYRLYYNEQGQPVCYTMEDLPGNYIEIDKDMFARSPTNIQVRDGKIFEITWQTTAKLSPGNAGTPCHPNDVTVIVDHLDPHQYWSKNSHGFKSN